MDSKKWETAHEARREQGRQQRRDREEALINERDALDPPDEQLTREERYLRDIQKSSMDRHYADNKE